MQMAKIKGRYVALITVDFEAGVNEPGVRSFEEISESLRNGEADKEIKRAIECTFDGTAKVARLYTDVYEVEEDGRT